ncbi:DNA alkylation repair protein [Paenibacillus sp. UMB4589-SE434]|uniref:DNA alkylation repair protein n=1 Tax=Paenibacillus sp. UMB4589-SE434 TaxID=3046314 RepID=UPI00254AB211|nr:DNA alkylation repair protein [Paenibacillus sp. UMB4589-SE434]MDK8180086.1 DNA alkylation repair protein [Paenibacillus sp. UMB4589-SE434]
MEMTLKEQLLELAEPGYQAFSAALIPNINNVLGVRLPELRKIAKKMATGNWTGNFIENQAEWFEEVMVHGMIIGYLKADIDEVLYHIAAFIPSIDNWSVCDSFCAGLKVTQKHKEHVWDFLQPYFESTNEYDLRFAVVMLLNYYVDDIYLDAVLKKLDGIKHEAYYVKMAVAWAISICFIKMPEPTMTYLKSNSLDNDTFNKALQKITESFRVDQETKRIIRSMKRK